MSKGTNLYPTVLETHANTSYPPLLGEELWTLDEKSSSESGSSDEEWEPVRRKRRRPTRRTVKGVLYCRNKQQAIKVAQEAIREEVASKAELLISQKRKSGKSVVLTLPRKSLPDILVIGGQEFQVHSFVQKAACAADTVPVDRCTNVEPCSVSLKESVQVILQSLQELIHKIGLEC